MSATWGPNDDHEDDEMFTCPNCGEQMLYWQRQDHLYHRPPRQFTFFDTLLAILAVGLLITLVTWAIG